jgi:two-component system NtrC family response regulator
MESFSVRIMKVMADTGVEKGKGASLRKLLIVDDDEQVVKQVQWALSDEYRVFRAGDRDAALSVFTSENIPVVLLDLGLPPHPREAIEGLAAIEDLIAQDPLVKVIIVSGNSERKNALLAVEKGAHDIFPKPIDLEELKVVLHRVYKKVELEKENLEEQNLLLQGAFENIIGSSSAISKVFAMIRKVAVTDVPVLITGESGTGKELIANAIHSLGPRKGGPFVAINCGAILGTLLETELFGHEKGSFTGATAQRRGKFEYAQGGTLFLDEIGDLAPELQVKILRFLQEKVIERVGGRESISIDTRVIAATHADLELSVRENRFREDLYFRLAVVRLSLPPLRERGDDVIQLAEHLIAVFSNELRKNPKMLSKPALEAIRQWNWPGNVRELQNRVKRAVVFADGQLIGPDDLELEIPPAGGPAPGATLKQAKEELEREIVAKALQQKSRNISRTAKALGISRPTLYELMSRYRL